jgi:hypothetical protein
MGEAQDEMVWKCFSHLLILQQAKGTGFVLREKNLSIEMKARPPPRAKTPSVTIYLDDWDSKISPLISSTHTRITRWIPM